MSDKRYGKKLVSRPDTTDDFVSAVTAFVVRRKLLWEDSKIVIALSGGPDSVALTLALWEAAKRGVLPSPIGTAHFHHGLRGEDADEDAAFSAHLSAQLGLPCAIGIGTVRHSPYSPNDAARQARYSFLTEIAQEWGANTLVTAHNADDQAETVLGRILRGTSIDGLAGIPAKRTLAPGLIVVRPLLETRRSAIEAYCHAQGITPRRDPSNEKDRYTRSRLRKTIPQLAEAFNPNLVESLSRLAENAFHDSDYLETQAEQLWQLVAREVSDRQIRLDASPLRLAPRALCRRVLRMGLERLVGDTSHRAEIVTNEWITYIESFVTQERFGIPDDLPGGFRFRLQNSELYLFRGDDKGKV